MHAVHDSATGADEEPVVDASTAMSGPQQLKKVMDKVMYFATREKSKAVTESGTAVYCMLLRSVIAAAGGSAVALAATNNTTASAAAVAARTAIDECIKEVFDKRKTRWGYGALSSFVKKDPENLPELLLPQLLDKARTARSEFLQVEALKLCNVCFRYDYLDLPVSILSPSVAQRDSMLELPAQTHPIASESTQCLLPSFSLRDSGTCPGCSIHPHNFPVEQLMEYT